MPGGALSHGLERLTVRGNQIVTAATGRSVSLRGIARSGLEYSAPTGRGALRNARIRSAEIQEMVAAWGANIIRLPFNQDWALTFGSNDPEPYLSALDFVIDAAASHGAYTLLDLHWLDAMTPRGRLSDGSINFVPPLPNLRSIQLWTELAARYRDEPAVLYDIFNEPHDALPDDTVPLYGIRDDYSLFALKSGRVSMEEWQPWALQLIHAIRSQNPDALIFVPGIDWSYDLRGFPLEEQGIVYSTHVYRNKGEDAADWDRAFGFLAESHPVFAGELGGGAEDLEWGQKLLDYLEERSIGWAAWSWSDAPYLLTSRLTTDYTPSEFGRVIQRALRA
jgi:hypothetical protein